MLSIEKKMKVYVDSDYMMVGSIELLGNLINEGLKPEFAHRKKLNGHWTFAFKTDAELKMVLMKYASDYDIIYRNKIYEVNYGEKIKVCEKGDGELRYLEKNI